MPRRLLVMAALLQPMSLRAVPPPPAAHCFYTVEESDPDSGAVREVERPGLCEDEARQRNAPATQHGFAYVQSPIQTKPGLFAYEEVHFLRMRRTEDPVPDFLEERRQRARAFIDAGALALAQRNFQAAIAEASASLGVIPTPQAYLVRSAAQNASGRYKEALSDADQGLALAPGDRALLDARSFALDRLARPDAGSAAPAAGETAPPRKEPAGAGGFPLTPLAVLFVTMGAGILVGVKLAVRGAAPLASVERAPAAAPLLRGRYELKGKIGTGGMGIVFEGFDHSLGRRVAVKQMRSEIKDDSQQRDTFLREARIISHLSHPYIVAIHEVVEENGEIYLIFDYVDGKPLSQILAEKKRLSLPECQRLFTYVCEAIACAHRSHILHRDLKPSNIMVDANGYAKVMDFGIAREAKETVARLTHADTSGTPAYMAPEQHLGRCGRPSDIYALGVCLYEAMTGHLPFPGPDFLVQKERTKYPPPQFLAPDLPKETELLFAATLALDPKVRVADATELLESLKSLPS
ncbi:MAG: protein kinase [Elusimicrobia bacterium]|nr:protein kinase [Elusimicrobiota bacterium]